MDAPEVGVTQEENTLPKPASKTAQMNSPKVWKELRKFTRNGFIRAIPPNCQDIVMPYRLKYGKLHYVPSTKWKEQDRVVNDLTAGEGSVNKTSPEQNWETVQCDYIEWVVEELLLYLRGICESAPNGNAYNS